MKMEVITLSEICESDFSKSIINGTGYAIRTGAPSGKS
jgi:hypothetical protein